MNQVKVANKQDKINRTQRLLDYYNGMEQEFYLLKGILCMDHPEIAVGDYKGADLYENSMIAKRMDEIRNGNTPEIICARCGCEGVRPFVAGGNFCGKCANMDDLITA